MAEEKELKPTAGEVVMTTREIAELYGLLKPARLTKMTDTGAKIAVVKDTRALKAVTADFEDFQKDALEKLQGADFAEWQEKARKWQGKTAKTAEEQKEVGAINAYFGRYQDEVTKCLDEESGRKHTITMEKVGEEQFGRLCDSNDWTVEQIVSLYERLV